MSDVVQRSIELSTLRLDGGTQPRAVISPAMVATYAEHMRARVPAFPPIVVFSDGSNYWLADGFHRVRAAESIGRTELDAMIYVGTQGDAVAYAVRANQDVGFPRGREDKRHIVRMAIADPELSKLPLRELARMCGVSKDLVIDVRAGRRMRSASSKAKPRSTRAARMASRLAALADMAERGLSSRQMGATLKLPYARIKRIARSAGIAIPADAIVGRTAQLDPNRIVDQMAEQAEQLTTDVGLIEFGGLDRARVRGWVESFTRSRRALTEFIRRLAGELQDDENVEESRSGADT